MNQINNVLESYKQRFISTSSRSRSFFLSKLHNKHSIDMVSIDEMFGTDDNFKNQLLNKEIFEFVKRKIDITSLRDVISSDSSTHDDVIKIIPIFTKKDFNDTKQLLKQYKFKTYDSLLNETKSIFEDNSTNDDFSVILDTFLSNTLTKERLEEFIPSFHPDSFDEFRDIISSYKEYNKYLKEQINLLAEKYSKLMNKDFISVEKIVKTANNLSKDTGKNDLYLGYPFVLGRFSSGKYFRAPLVLHRIKIKSNNKSISIKIEDKESLINPVFLISYFIENDKEHKKLDWSIKSDDYITDTIKTLEGYGIKLNLEQTNLEKFSSLTKTDFEKNNYMDHNTYKVLDNCVLGIFPISDKNIYNDLEDLENFDFKDDDSIANFIIGNENADTLFEEKKYERIKEQDIYYINDLDFSQKLIVKKALEGNLVIEGPPGTGKSQVLSNIVANYVARGKKVLVVSEKLAALEVIYNRIGKLSENSLLIKNHLQDKESFYTQLKNAISNITVKPNSDTYDSFEDIDSKLEYIFDKLESRDDLYAMNIYGYDMKSFLELHTLELPTIDNTINYLNNVYDTSNIDPTEVLEFIDSSVVPEKLELFNKVNGIINSNNATLLNLKATISVIEQHSNNSNKNYMNFLYHLGLNDIKIFNNCPAIDLGETELVECTYDKLYSDISNVLATDESIKFDKHYKEISKEFYSDKKVNKKLKRLLKRWENYTVKERVLAIKQIKDITFKFSVLPFKKPMSYLDTFELELYQDIEDNIDDLNHEDIIPFKIDKYLEYIYKTCLNTDNHDIDYLIQLMVKSSLVSIKIDVNVADEIDMLVKSLSNEDLTYIKKFTTSISTKEYELFTAISTDNLLDKDILKKSIFKYLTYFRYEEISDTLKFFAEYDVVYDDSKKKIKEKTYKSRLLVESKVKDKIMSQRKVSNYAKVINELLRLSELKRKRSITKVMTEYNQEILSLFPVCLMTPGVVSALLPNDIEMFDVVVFDEASQMFVEHAVPSIHRARRVIVSGDSKQLKPSSIFSTRFVESDVEDEDYSIDEIAALEEESLLDYSKNKYRYELLRYHYRSDSKELIEFSNRAFYNGELVFSSKVDAQEPKPIELIEVDGRWINNTNDLEVDKVVELILSILESRENNETIGVITFNQKQRDKITDILENLSLENELLLKEMNRVNFIDHTDESLFIKNIENVQGDERDIIIFSVAYGYDAKGKFANRFGSLSQPGGDNRLNVAITRARKKVYVVKSINSDVLNVNENNRGPFLFKKYLQYAEILNKGNDCSNLLNQLSDLTKDNTNLTDFDSAFEIEVYDMINKYLDKDKYELRNQVGVGSFRIDLAIYDKTTNLYVLGIECDGAMYHSSTEAVERDFYRQRYLESRGWNIHRIWSTNWWTSQDREIDKLSTLYKDYFIS